MITNISRGLIILCLLASASIFGCIEVRDPDVDGPTPPGSLDVVATASPDTLFEGGGVELKAVATGGSGEIAFQWDQNAGPSVTLDDVNSANITIASLAAPGSYVFRVMASDAGGQRADDFVTVTVLEAVTVEAPDFALIGQPVELRAEVPADADTPAGFLWEIVEGTAQLEPTDASTTNFTAQASETVRVRLMVFFEGGSQPAATRDFDIVAVPDHTPRVRIETNMGGFTIELDGVNTPRHMVNFLRYVDEGFYEGLLFHRNVCTDDPETEECERFVLQGGGYRRVGDELVEVEPTHPTVEQENENSRSNGVLYTVALALRGGDSNTGAAQFFINLNEENDFLDDSGFTAFAIVVEGTDVVDALSATERVESPLIPGEVSLPAVDIVITSVRRAE